MTEDVLKGYAQAATPEFIDRLEAIDTADLLRPIQSFLPRMPARILDIGAGTGRDAAWFARHGHSVVAVEPVPALRQAGQALHTSPSIEWHADTLPELRNISRLDLQFDTILLSAVWHHINEHARAKALPVLRNLSRPQGRILISVRHGPGAAGRPAYPIDIARTLSAAEDHGLHAVAQVDAPAMQVGNRLAGVSWTWLVLEASAR